MRLLKRVGLGLLLLGALALIIFTVETTIAFVLNMSWRLAIITAGTLVIAYILGALWDRDDIDDFFDKPPS